MSRIFFVLAVVCLALAATNAQIYKAADLKTEEAKVSDLKTEEAKAADLKTEEAIYYGYTGGYYPTVARADLAYPYAYSGYNYAYPSLAARSIYY